MIHGGRQLCAPALGGIGAMIPVSPTLALSTRYSMAPRPRHHLRRPFNINARASDFESVAESHKRLAVSAILFSLLSFTCMTSAPHAAMATDAAASNTKPEMLSIGVPAPQPRANVPDLKYDQYGNPTQTICPVAYFPCYQDGYFCFRPIYCKGQFSPEGSLNAMIILGGILAPAYSIWKRKTGQEPDPNTPEGLVYWKNKYSIQDRSAEKQPKSSFFSRNIDSQGDAGGD